MPETIPATEPIERRADELERYKVDTGEYPESELPPGVFDYDYLQKGPGVTTMAYLNFEGRRPDITNHISRVTYEIIAGAGTIATKEGYTNFNVRSENLEQVAVTIPRGKRYWLNGNFSALVKWPVPPYKDFITFGDEKLSRAASQELEAAKRLQRRRQFTTEIIGAMDFIMPTILEMQALDRQCSALNV